MTSLRAHFVSLAAVTAALTGLLATSGCGLSLPAEGICSSGEAPVYAIDNPYGAQCIKDGHPAPDRMAFYPAKRVPRHVGDAYDRWPMAKSYPWRDEVDPTLLAQVPATVQEHPDTALR